VDCYDEYNDCMGGLISDNPVQCISGYRQCLDAGTRDRDQACSSFLRGFRADTRRALRTADREDVDDGFVEWFFSDTDSRNECIDPALSISFVCAGIVE
jgi:hypothetical protein